jgi:hypothetical protein
MRGREKGRGERGEGKGEMRKKRNVKEKGKCEEKGERVNARGKEKE